ncbi:hypothetical protein EIP91_002100 [Steccherinum ochraceum]|uniref:Uncharacterized protein n=1 Tax=Steccherinum ochraceum TaxID=92696 RepID=A0A4R0S2P6_9APHY|nr:hypothetical protein EIP91_002100 [Steccherinum ochraceum]
MSSLALSRPFAAAVVGGTAATLGYMYVAGSRVKKQEGPASIYKPTEETAGGQANLNANDSRMSSKDVREVMQGEKASQPLVGVRAENAAAASKPRV